MTSDTPWGTRALATLLVAGAVVTAAIVVDYATRKTITLDVDGNPQRIRTHADTVRSALDDANMTLAPEDNVYPSLDTALNDGDTITVRRAALVVIDTDGALQQVRTQVTHPLDILAENNIALGEYDALRIDGRDYGQTAAMARPWTQAPARIRVIRSATVRVIDDHRVMLIHTTQTDVARVLDSAGLELYLADRITPGLDAPVEDGLAVRIERSVPLTVIADGRQVNTRAVGATVGDALATIGFAPVGLDYTLPALDAPLEANATIRIVRVDEVIVTERVPIPFDTRREIDPALAPGAERERQAGADGVLERQIRVRHEDGVEVSRVTHTERIIEPPTPRVLAVGQ